MPYEGEKGADDQMAEEMYDRPPSDPNATQDVKTILRELGGSLHNLRNWTADKIIAATDVLWKYKRPVIEQKYKYMLESGQFNVAQLKGDAELLAAAQQYLRQKHAHLHNPNFTSQLLAGPYAADIETALDETMIESLLATGRLSVSMLKDPETGQVLERAAKAYLVKRYPHLSFDDDFSAMLRKQGWLQEIEVALHAASHGDDRG